jgi:hypothetical protein
VCGTTSGSTLPELVAGRYAFVSVATWIALMLACVTLPAPVDWHWSSAFSRQR